MILSIQIAKSTLIVIESTFNRLFQSDFEARFYIVATKSIKSAANLIKKFELDQKRSKIDQKDQFLQLNSTFLI